MTSLLTELSVPRFRVLLRHVGNVLAISGVGYVAYMIVGYSEEISNKYIVQGVWVPISLLVVAYACANFLLSLAWGRILLGFGVQLPFREILRMYGVSQLAKYAPGNFLHFVSRHALGASRNITSVVLLGATGIEVASLVFAAGLFSLLAASRFLAGTGLLGISSQAILVVLLLCYSSVMFFVMRRLGKKAFAGFLFHVMFFCASCLVFLAVVILLFESGNWSVDSILVIISGYVTAWLLGFIAPGAPAGLGVREVVLVYLLGSYIPEQTLLLAILLTRVVNVLGDLVFYGFSLLMLPNGGRLDSQR